MVYIVSFLVFVMAVFAGVFLIERRRAAALQVAERLGLESFDLVGEKPLSRRNILLAGLERLRHSVGRALPGVAVDEYNRKLIRAGSPFNLKGEEFYLVKIILGLLPPVIIPVVLLLGSGGKIVAILSLAGLALYFAPDLWLSSKEQSRQKMIAKELLPFVDVLAVCSDAGLNLGEAMKRTIEFQPGVLGDEFRRFHRDLESGSTRSEAFNDMAYRNGVDELDSLVLALNQAEKYGTPIARMLREQAKLMRTQRRNRAQEMAQTASVKILLPVILFDFLPLLVILLGPAVINLGRSLNL